METKIKWLAIIEAIVIIILLAALINPYAVNNKIRKPLNGGLLSSRIYSGLLEPKSFMIVNFAPLKSDIQAYITSNNLNVSVYIENFRNGAFSGINEKAGFFPASLNKLPVAILIMRKIEQGELSFDTKLSIQDSDRMEGLGNLYKTKDKEFSVRILLQKLLRESDNTALNVLLRQIEAEDLMFLQDYYGIMANAELGNKKESQELVTPKSMSNIFSSLYFSTVLEPYYSEYILNLLKNTTFDINKLANIPDDITITHKFGINYANNNRYFHDCGIMYINESRIFYCIMTQNLDPDKAKEAIGAIANGIYTYVIAAKASYEDYKREAN